jgi:hypothetical protein
MERIYALVGPHARLGRLLGRSPAKGLIGKRGGSDQASGREDADKSLFGIHGFSPSGQMPARISWANARTSELISTVQVLFSWDVPRSNTMSGNGYLCSDAILA